MRSAASPRRSRRRSARTWASRPAGLTRLALAAALAGAALLPLPARAGYTAQEARRLAGELKNAGVRAYQEARLTEAVEKLTATIDINLNDFFAHFYLGLAYRDLGRYPEARQVLEIASQLDPRYLPVYVALGDVALGQGDPGEARTWFQTALNDQDTYAPALDGMGRLAEAEGKDDLAIEKYRQAIASNRGYPDPYVHLGDLFRREGRFDDAIELFQEAIRYQPGFAEGYLFLGLAYDRLGRTVEAAALLEEAAELEPENPDPRIALGDLLARGNDRVQARIEYEAARGLAPGRAEPLLGLAWLARLEGRHDDALALLAEAAGLPDLDEETRIDIAARIATVEAESRKVDFARRRLAAAEGDAAETAWARLSVARLRRDAGDMPGALADCRAALEPLERPVDLVSECGYYALQAEDWGAAHELLAEAAERDPADVNHLINDGLALTGLGRLPSAVLAYRQALEVNPRSVEATVYQANALYRLGVMERAEELYRKAQALTTDPDLLGRLQGVLLHLEDLRLQRIAPPPPEEAEEEDVP